MISNRHQMSPFLCVLTHRLLLYFSQLCCFIGLSACFLNFYKTWRPVPSPPSIRRCRTHSQKLSSLYFEVSASEQPWRTKARVMRSKPRADLTSWCRAGSRRPSASAACWAWSCCGRWTSCRSGRRCPGSRCCWRAGCWVAAAPLAPWSTGARPSSSDGRRRRWCIPAAHTDRGVRNLLHIKPREQELFLWCKLYTSVIFTNLTVLWSFLWQGSVFLEMAVNLKCGASDHRSLWCLFTQNKHVESHRVAVCVSLLMFLSQIHAIASKLFPSAALKAYLGFRCIEELI